MRALLLGLTLLAGGPAFAGSLAGVTMPDAVEVGGKQLVLNGMGLREKYFLDIYVGGLYLPAKTTDAARAIRDDVPKRIAMTFRYSLSQKKLADTMREGVTGSGDAEAMQHADTLASWMEAVVKGDEIVLDYVPGKGTSVVVKGSSKGTIPGAAFMRAIWGIYLGPNPPTAALKRGLMGG